MAIQLGSGAYVLSGLQVIRHVLRYSSRPALLNQVRGQENVHKDSGGEPIAVGDEVRILSIPQWLTNDLPEEDVLRLKAQEGKVMRVLEVDAHGYLWFGAENAGRWFCLRPAEVRVVQP